MTSGCAPTPACTGNGVIAPLRDGRGAEPGVKDTRRPPFWTAGKVDWRVSVDSTAVRAHVHAAGARGDGVERVEGEPDDHALGRSRGGWGTEIHAAVEAGLGVMSLLLTAGQAGDCPMMIPVLEAISAERPARGRPRTRPDRVLADRAYSSRANRDWLRAHHIHATIQAPTPRQPSSPNQPHQTTSMSPRTDKPKQSTATVR